MGKAAAEKYRSEISEAFLWRPLGARQFWPPDKFPEQNVKQTILLSPLMESVRDVFFGGAGGGGKTDGLLLDALKYVHVPDYSAIILRRTYTDLAMPKAIMDRLVEWKRLYWSNVHWDAVKKQMTFPSGARITFGFMQRVGQETKLTGPDFQFIGVDELTQFAQGQLTFLFSRLRRPSTGPLSRVPLRIRTASNPGGIGHEWVKQRYITPYETGTMPLGRAFIPASLYDNPFIDAAEYRATLGEMDDTRRAQIEDGNWNVTIRGAYFDPEWFRRVDEIPRDRVITWVRFWDMASSEPSPLYPDPDYTVGALVGRDQYGDFWIRDIVRLRATPGQVKRRIAETAKADGYHVAIRMEQEAGASGKAIIDEYLTGPLIGYDFDGVRPSGPKTARAKPVSTMAEHGHYYIINAPWNADFDFEFQSFDNGAHDDIVDSVSGAHKYLTQGEDEEKGLPVPQGMTAISTAGNLRGE